MTMNTMNTTMCKALLLLLIFSMSAFVYAEASWYEQNNKNIIGNNLLMQSLVPQDPKIIKSIPRRKVESFNDYFQQYFSPWHDNIMFTAEDFKALVGKYKDKVGPSYQKLDSYWLSALESNCNVSQFNQALAKAIVVHNTALRVLPTLEPIFADPNQAGEGFPFDLLQDDFLRVGEPVLISHYSLDGVFAFVQTNSLAKGFILTKDLAIVDANFINTYTSAAVMIKQDRLNLNNDTKLALTTPLLLGTVLPLASQEVVQGQRALLMPIRNLHGFADFTTIKLDSSNILTKPLMFNKSNVVNIVSQLLNKPYGWGGYMLHRDCARLVRDYFSVFGMFLPLYSRDQAKVGASIELENLSPAEKLATILASAVPGQSLIYMPGHIGLYLGSYDGKPIILHAVWGIKLFDDQQNEYRYVIGKSIFSDLELGKGLQGYLDNKSILARTLKIVNL